MSAFSGNHEVNEKYLALIRQNRAAGRLVQGVGGWDEETKSGSAIACTLGEWAPMLYEESELNLPAWFAFLENAIFERLLPADARVWPEQVLEAIRPDGNVDEIKGPFLVLLFKHTLNSFSDLESMAVKNVI